MLVTFSASATPMRVQRSRVKETRRLLFSRKRITCAYISDRQRQRQVQHAARDDVRFVAASPAGGRRNTTAAVEPARGPGSLHPVVSTLVLYTGIPSTSCPISLLPTLCSARRCSRCPWASRALRKARGRSLCHGHGT